MGRRYVFMMFGYAGGGKSFVARWLAVHRQAVHLRADGLRLAMFGEDRPDLYTSANKALVNNALQYASKKILQAGVSDVVHDANHNQRSVRHKIEKLARDHGAIPVVVWVQTPEATAKERIASRAVTEGHIIFDPHIIEHMRKTTNDPGDDELVITINGQQTAEEQRISFDRQLADLATKPELV